MRKIYTSRDMATQMSLHKQKRIDVYSFFPVDRADCECQEVIKEWRDKLALMPKEEISQEIAKQEYITCPRDKAGLNRYEITCGSCGEVQGYCWASDETLTDWCDFHYVQWTNGKEWKGCLTPQISPIDESLCLECACGLDSRDFRANMTLPSIVASEKESSNKVGREFGKINSKFKVEKVRSNTKISINYLKNG